MVRAPVPRNYFCNRLPKFILNNSKNPKNSKNSPEQKAANGKSENLQEKTNISAIPQKKSNEIDFKQEEPYWNWILRLPGAEEHTSNKSPEEKQEIRHSRKFNLSYKNMNFYDF